jgi:hypothetical protein
MLKLTKDEIAFLRWLRTNGGTASLSGPLKAGSMDRIVSAAYIIVEADAHRQGRVRYTLTEHGHEAFGLYET